MASVFESAQSAFDVAFGVGTVTAGYSATEHACPADSDGNARTFSEHALARSGGRTASVTHRQDVMTTETLGSDGSLSRTIVYGNGDEETYRYDSSGTLQYHETITEHSRSSEEYFGDGSRVEYRHEFGYGEETTYYAADGGSEYVRLNPEGVIVRQSVDLPSGHYETWEYDDGGTLEKHQTIAPDGKNHIEYFVDDRIYVESGMIGQGSIGAFETDSGIYNLVLGSFGDDALAGDGDVNIYGGGWGDDTITIQGERNLLLFNQDEGNDTVRFVDGADGKLALSLGNVSLDELSISRTADDLVLGAGRGSITFAAWYTGHEIVDRLQVIVDSSQDYRPEEMDDLYSAKVHAFDFAALVHLANLQADTSTPWFLSSGLRDASLGGSDATAIGGALAYQHAHGMELTYLPASIKAGVAEGALVSLIGQPIEPVGEVPGGVLRA